MVCARLRRVPALGREVETPRLDAALPGRVHEAHVAGGLGDDEQAAVEIGEGLGRVVLAVVEVVEVLEAILVGARRRVVGVGQAGEAGDALRVGDAGGEHRAVAVLDGDARACRGLGVVERRHPGERVLARPFEVDREVGDQRAGGHVHRVAALEQRRAEARALELDEVEAGAVEGQADDLHGLRPVRLREGEGGRRGAGRQSREHRLAAPRRAEAAKPRQHVFGLLDLRHRSGQVRVELLQLGAPGGGTLARGAQLLARGLRIEVADGDGQGRLSLGFEQAEARGELGEGREGRRLHRQRRGAGEGAVGVVVQAVGQLDAIGRLRRERRRELEIADELARLARRVRGQALAVARHQLHLLRLRPAHRRGEHEPDGRERGAVGLGVLALAARPRG